MNKKLLILTLSVLTMIFLTAQTCANFGATGLALDCIGDGDIVCDDTEAYQCQYSATGYFVTRASGYDVSDCGATATSSSATTTTSGASDSDGDGMSDRYEILYGFDPADSDEDGDGIVDGMNDADGDGLKNVKEEEARTDPTNTDTDGDSYDDKFELFKGSDPLDSSDFPAFTIPTNTTTTIPTFIVSCTTNLDCSDNFACDTSSSPNVCFEECDYGIDQCDTGYACYKTSTTNYGCQEDTDLDGLPDVWESSLGIDETLKDTDNDGLTDYEEVLDTYGYNTYPTSGDTDGDGLKDGDEITAGTDPTDTDSDDDGLSDALEVTATLDPATNELSGSVILDFDADSINYTAYDTDGDGYTDYFGTSSDPAGFVTGDVDTIIEDQNYIVDLTSTTSDDYVAFPPAESSVKWGVSNWVVIKALVKPESDTTGTQPIVLHATHVCYRPQYALDVINDEYRLSINFDGTTESLYGGVATSGTWQEVIGVYKDNKMYLFVDGELVDSVGTTGAITTSTKGLLFGHSDPTLVCSNTYDYEGYIDTIQIWGN